MNIPNTTPTPVARPTNVIGIIGSPRAGGNTAFVVEQILEGARAQGAQTQAFSCAKLAIEPCRGCWVCHKSDRGCVIRDDMDRLNEAIDRADAIVFASPIYMMQMSAQAKIVVDRLFARFSPKYSPYYRPESAAQKKLLLSFNQGNPDAQLFRTYIDYTRRMFELLEFDVREAPVVTGLRNGPASEQPGLTQALQQLGEQLAAR